jgi:hypothetical protein
VGRGLGLELGRISSTAVRHVEGSDELDVHGRNHGWIADEGRLVQVRRISEEAHRVLWHHVQEHHRVDGRLTEAVDGGIDVGKHRLLGSSVHLGHLRRSLGD